MHRPLDETQRDLNLSVSFVSGDKEYLELNDFLEFHRNIYYVQPQENLENFINV
jgi:hypothetical protein